MSHTKLGLKLFTEVWMLLTLAMNLNVSETNYVAVQKIKIINRKE